LIEEGLVFSVRHKPQKCGHFDFFQNIGLIMRWDALGVILGIIGITFGVGAWYQADKHNTEMFNDEIEKIKESYALKTELLEISDLSGFEKLLPIGTILAWDPIVRTINGQPSGQTRKIPSGWLVGDGKNGTPNLSNRFLVGTATLSDAGKIGGSSTHKHVVTLGTATVKEHRSGTQNDGAAHSEHVHSTNVSEFSNIPPYHTVVYIVKVE